MLRIPTVITISFIANSLFQKPYERVSHSIQGLQLLPYFLRKYNNIIAAILKYLFTSYMTLLIDISTLGNLHCLRNLRLITNNFRYFSLLWCCFVPFQVKRQLEYENKISLIIALNEHVIPGFTHLAMASIFHWGVRGIWIRYVWGFFFNIL